MVEFGLPLRSTSVRRQLEERHVKWMEHTCEVDRSICGFSGSGGFEFWRKRNGVAATSRETNLFSRETGGWLAARGTPKGVRSRETAPALTETRSISRRRRTDGT